VTTYIPTGIGSVVSEQELLIEQRVTNNLLQSDMGRASQDDLRLMRNDIALSLGLVPPVVPGD
jgi:hypothetical protein